MPIDTVASHPGEARARLAPEGYVRLEDDGKHAGLWKARALNGPIEEGANVRVRRVDGLPLLV